MFDQICFADAGRSDQDHVLLDVFNFLGAVWILFLEPPKVIGVVVMIANRNREDFLRFLLFDDKPVEMRFDIARQQMEFEFLVLGFLRLFILLCDRWLRLGNCRNRDAVAEVLFHEVRDLGLQLFGRRKLWWCGGGFCAM